MKKKNFKIKDSIKTKTIKKTKEEKMKGLTIQGYGVFETRDKEGNVIEREEKHNLIVNSGLQAVAKLIAAGEAKDAFSYIAIGLGESADSVTEEDLELKSEVKREQANDSGKYEHPYKANFEKTFTFESGESFEITEVGLFNGESGSVMLDRFIIDAKPVDIDTDLYVKITITVGRE